MQIQIFNQNGKNDSTVELSKNIFGQDFNGDLVHQLITTYIDNGHQNTKGQKNRSAVRGGGKKPWAQKGTGRARAGTIRSPIWRGGGITFAHKYQDVKPKKINKKMYRSAMRSIWSKLAEEGRIIVIEDFSIETPPKSSQIKLILSNLGFTSALAVLATSNEALSLASKNLEEFNIQTLNSINPAELLSAKQVILTSETLESLSKVLS
jgi:large subunit ribosomal protein L4|tara:strand:+ start:9278 stop:9901 length:624 start_codon:yes stop_codon:yes gene_type:complete